MIKALLLSATMMAAAPVMAQETAPQPQPGAPTEQSMPADALPSQPETAAEDVATTEAAPASQTAAAEAATTNSADTVAQVVEAEFASYDGDADGELTQAEFARWMTALRASQPGGTAEGDSASWANAAFAQADTDSNSKVSRGELTTFLQG